MWMHLRINKQTRKTPGEEARDRMPLLPGLTVVRDSEITEDEEYSWSAWLTLAVIIVGGLCVAAYYLKWMK